MLINNKKKLVESKKREEKIGFLILQKKLNSSCEFPNPVQK
jgi:hypothetical protein